MDSRRFISMLYIFVSCLFFVFLLFLLISVGFILAWEELFLWEHLLNSEFSLFIIPSGWLFLLIDLLYLYVIYLLRKILKNLKGKSLFVATNKKYFSHIALASLIIFLFDFSPSLQWFILISLVVLLIAIIFVAFRMHEENQELQKDKDLTI